MKDSFAIGQRVFVSITLNRQDRYYANITKIGRKWVYFQHSDRSCENGRFEIAHNGEWWIDGGDYSSPGKVYVSKEAYQEETFVKKAWTDTGLNRMYNPPAHLTLKDMQKIRAILGVEEWEPTQ